MSQYIDKVLEKSEKKKWEGKINRKVMITGLVIWLVIIIGISIFFFTRGTINYFLNDKPATTSGSLIGIIILIIGLFFVLWGFFSNLVTEYSITNKRLIIKSGIIGTDYKSIYFEQMTGVNVNVGIIGKIFRTGNVQIDTGKTETYSTGDMQVGKTRTPQQIKTRTMYDVLKNIDNPYDVYNILHPSITGRRESLYSGRADRESNPEYYKKE